MTTMTMNITVSGLALPTDADKFQIQDGVTEILKAHAKALGFESDVKISFRDQQINAASKSIPAALIIRGAKVKASLMDLLNRCVGAFDFDQEVKLFMK